MAFVITLMDFSWRFSLFARIILYYNSSNNTFEFGNRFQLEEFVQVIIMMLFGSLYRLLD